MTTPTTVVVIGGGPGAMSFCHALEWYKNELKQAGDVEALARLPLVTCFERDSGPGGVWRAQSSFSPTDEAQVNMYAGLWTNTAKECIEYFDYTFDEHFKCPLPVYMPRQPLLDYIITRCTKNCPDFFEKYMIFNTNVESVKYVESKRKFEVVTRNVLSGDEIMGEYDKCVWAGGETGRPNMPRSLVSVFHDGGFQGRVIHSSDTANFEEDVKGKRILIIGGSFSAEDLCLMAIKCGVEKVYIATRSDENVVLWTGAWCQDKVEILSALLPTGIAENGSSIHLSKVDWEWPNDFIPRSKVKMQLRDISTVIFCTGYLSNVDMLEPELSRDFVPKERKLQVPKDWKMEPNVMTEVLGDIEPGDARWTDGLVELPGIYHGINISNPSMMFLCGHDFENPLMGVEVSAWLAMRAVTGVREILPANEMRKRNLQLALRSMQSPYFRFLLDRNYRQAVDDNWKLVKKAYREFESFAQSNHFRHRRLAGMMQEAQYPASWGSFDELNERGEAVALYDRLTNKHRSDLRYMSEDEHSWRTFRDYSDGGDFKSVFTGQSAVSLKGRWLDLDANDEDILKLLASST